jgi:hypothetical protein
VDADKRNNLDFCHFSSLGGFDVSSVAWEVTLLLEIKNQNAMLD